MGASSKTPDVPDYTGAAQTQAQSNKDIATMLTAANRPNQIDPYGQTTWTQAPVAKTAAQQQAQATLDAYAAYNANPAAYGWDQGALDYINSVRAPVAQKALDAANAAAPQGQWTQTTTYSPEQQALLNQKQKIQGTQNDMISQLLAKYQGNMPQQAQTQAFNPVGLQHSNQGDLANQMYQQLTQNMDQQFTRDESSQRQNLANQGFQTGSEGFNNAMRDFFNQKNQAYGNANLQSQIAGYGQMNTENAQNLQNYLGQNQSGLNTYIAQHNANLSDYNTQMGYLAQLLGGTQGPATGQPSYPQFAQATPYQAPDLLGALSGQYQAQLNSTNAQNAARGQNMNSLGNLASIGAMAFL